MDSLGSRIFPIVHNLDLSDSAKIEQIKAVLAEVTVVPIAGGIIERLVVSLQKAGVYVNLSCTSANCPTSAEPSLVGARIDDKIVGSRTSVIAKLKQMGRRPATVAEGLLYGSTHPEELSATSWIWCLDQIVVAVGCENVLALYVGGGIRYASFSRVPCDVGVDDRVLSFLMTEAELAARDAEDAARHSA